MICNYCGSEGGHFPIHGILVCSACHSGIPEDEPDEQDLFDDDSDFLDAYPEPAEVLKDLLIQA